jgi:hypothetical protein
MGWGNVRHQRSLARRRLLAFRRNPTPQHRTGLHRSPTDI